MRSAGDFEFEVSNPDGFNTNGDTTLDAASCSVYTSDFTGRVMNPTFNGVIYLEGEIGSCNAVFTMSRIKSITASCDGTSFVTMTTLSGTDYESVGNGLSAFAGQEFKAALQDTVVDFVETAINEAIMAAEARLGFGGGFPIIRQFYQEAAARGIDSISQEALETAASWQAAATNTVANWATKVKDLIGQN